MDNFDLRNFLIENKLTFQSQLKEAASVQDIITKIKNNDFESLNNMPGDQKLVQTVFNTLKINNPDLVKKLTDFAEQNKNNLSEIKIKSNSFLALLLAFSLGSVTTLGVTKSLSKPGSDVEQRSSTGKTKGSVSFENAQKIVKMKEGGYQKNRNDAGNYIKTKRGRKLIGTKYGIAAPTLQNWFIKTGKISKKQTITSEDMKNLDYQTATEIFKNEYWDKNDLDVLNNQSFANLIYDGVVIHGSNGMAEALNQALKNQGLESPRGFSNKFSIINDLDTEEQEKLFNQIKKERNDILISQSRAERRTFGKGWNSRLNSFVYSPN